MNRYTRFIAMILCILLMVTSCEKEDKTPKPVISRLEVGISNSKKAYVGSDLHINAEILAKGIIDVIKVEILKEGASGDAIEVMYTDYSGLKNTNFHKHIDIPHGTKPGEYHFHLIVTDKQGNQTSVKEDVTIEELYDEEAPELTITLVPDPGKSHKTGDTIMISGTVTDNVGLAGLLVALVKESDDIPDEDVKGSSKSIIVLLHTHDFVNPKAHIFTALIAVGAEKDNNMVSATIEGSNAWRSGDYYILVKGKDAKGNTFKSTRVHLTLE